MTRIQHARSLKGWTQILDAGALSPLQLLYNLRVLTLMLEDDGEATADLRDRFGRSGGLLVILTLLENMLEDASKDKVGAGQKHTCIHTRTHT